MALRVVVLGVNREGERRDRLDHRRRKRIAGSVASLLLQRARELLEAPVNFLERLGAGGEQALERDAEIRFEHILLPSLAIVRIALLGAGNQVAALMLGKVHRGVRHLDELLRRGAVNRKGGDAEAGGDVLVAQQRIGGDPAAQFVGELASLLDGRFRHENHEFVAAVARHHVRAPAILFEDVADALQDDVALEVAVEIVDEFEPVEVHQDERERPVGARRALPFGRERLHQEAVRLDAGQPVGDGLLLSLLERERVVQRAGKKVGERAQQQDVLLGEFARLGGFHVENAEELLAVGDGQGDRSNRTGQNQVRGADALTSRTIAIWPLRATWPTRPSPSRMRRPTASRRAPASAWTTSSFAE